MSSLVFRKKQRRLTIVDRLSTDDGLGCHYGFYDVNNNKDDAIIGYFSSDYIEQFWPSMYETNNNDLPQRKRLIQLSSLLEDIEQKSVLQYVGPNASLLSSGICQLLQEIDGTWSLLSVGVVCFIRDYDNKKFSLTLVDPDEKGGPARVLWYTTVTRDFVTLKQHSHLVTFETETELFGLNFADEKEAAEFHSVSLEKRQTYLDRKASRRGPKRMAPAPPREGPSEILLDTTGTTTVGVELPVIRVEKKEKKGFLSSIFGGKKKKEKKKKKIDISAPTDFHHVQHGLESLTNEQKELLRTLCTNFKVEPGNKAQMDLLKNLVVEKYEDLTNVLAETEPENEKTKKMNNEGKGDRENAFKRTNSNGLADARSSIMISKTGRGNTPRDIKKQSLNRKHETDPLKAVWDDEAPYIPPSVPVELEALPPVPSRTASRRPGIQRRSTPPYSPHHSRLLSPDDPPPPRLPPRNDSRKPDSIIATAPPQSVLPVPTAPPLSIPPVPTAPPLSTTAPVAPPPPPPNLLLPKVTPPTGPPPPPPPSTIVSMRNPDPPLSLAVPVSVSSISPDRRSFLDEIASVDKTKLLRPIESLPSRPETTPTSPGRLGLIDSIQRELDARRHAMGSDSSDDDSESEEDSDSWTD